MIVHHGTPITPGEFLGELAGRAFCVSYARPDQLNALLVLAARLMIDNGAFSAFRKGRHVDWNAFYAWLEPILFAPGRWAVIPDVIDAGSQLQDALLNDWPFGFWGAPVWHMDEPIDRLERLCGEWPRVCIGSTGEYWNSDSDEWRGRMDDAWERLAQCNIGTAIHMLRAASAAPAYPFDSTDCTTLAQNGHRYDQCAFHQDLFGDQPRWAGRIAYANRIERRLAA